MVTAIEHRRGGAHRSLNCFANSRGGEVQVIATRCPGADRQLSLPRIRRGGEELSHETRILDSKLVNGPHAQWRLAQLPDRGRGVRIGRAQSSDRSIPPGDKLLKRPVVDSDTIHETPPSALEPGDDASAAQRVREEVEAEECRRGLLRDAE